MKVREKKTRDIEECVKERKNIKKKGKLENRRSDRENEAVNIEKK